MLAAASRAALSEGQESVGVPHVLRALADLPDSSGTRWLADAGIDPPALRALSAGWSDTSGAGDSWPGASPPIGASGGWSAEVGAALDWGERDFDAKRSSSELIEGLLNTSARFREELARHGVDASDRPDVPNRRGKGDFRGLLAAAAHPALTGGQHEVRLSHIMRALAAQPESDGARWLAGHGLGAAQLAALADRWEATGT